MAEVTEGFKGWAVLELMGHRQLVGYVQEVEVASVKMLRIDVHPPEGKSWSQFYGAAAIYCISPVTEDVARTILERSTPEPPFAWEVNHAMIRERVTKELDLYKSTRLPAPGEDHEAGETQDQDGDEAF